MRYLLPVFILTITLYAGFQLGRMFMNSDNQPQITENYSFVRDIAELASLEVRGVTSLNSSNVTNDGTFTDELRRIFIERTIRLSAPFTAKYGVNLGDSSLRIVRTDSILKIYLPQPTLLSYEIHFDRLQASNQKGWFRFQNDQEYSAFQKKMYTEGRAQLEKNNAYLTRSRDRICNIIQKYFAPQHIKTICIYGTNALQMPAGTP